MTTAAIQRHIARGIEIEQILSTLNKELKEIKAALKEEAEDRAEEKRPTDGGGWSWRHEDAEGHIVCVTQPGDKLKPFINPIAKDFPKIEALVGIKAWPHLFSNFNVFTLKKDFRDLAVAHLGGNAKKLIKLVTSDSEMKVSFEVADQ